MALVLIDPGHGGNRAIGGSSPYGSRGPSGSVEKDVNLQLARRVQQHLGSDAALTRQGDQNISLSERAGRAARYGARVFLSLHSNSGAPHQQGSQSWVHNTAHYGSRALAQRLQQSLRRLGGGPPCGVMSADLGVLRPAALGPQVDACLLEVDYLTHPQRERALRDPAHLDRLASEIAGAVRQHLAYGRRAPARGLDEIAPPDFDWNDWQSSLSALARWLTNRVRYESIPVQNTDIYPYNAICKLEIPGEPPGTGFFIGRNTILTAGHCCTHINTLNPLGQLTVVPALNDNRAAIRSFEVFAPEIIPHPSYDGGQDFDIGIIRTGSNHNEFFFDIEEQNFSPDSGIAIVGYVDGQDVQSIDTDTIREVHPNTYSYTAETRGGVSGSPVFYVDGELAVATGVHISGADGRNRGASPRVNVGCRLTQNKLDWIEANAGDQGVTIRRGYGRGHALRNGRRLQGPVRSQPRSSGSGSGRSFLQQGARFTGGYGSASRIVVGNAGWRDEMTRAMDAGQELEIVFTGDKLLQLFDDTVSYAMNQGWQLLDPGVELVTSMLEAASELPRIIYDEISAYLREQLPWPLSSVFGQSQGRSYGAAPVVVIALVVVALMIYCYFMYQEYADLQSDNDTRDVMQECIRRGYHLETRLNSSRLNGVEVGEDNGQMNTHGSGELVLICVPN